ncbi:MAG: hypothetical protein FJ359_04365 [Thaumarchaeota archaeon]|nr:hypothetical protein [Nitrososphaerota archaeon]
MNGNEHQHQKHGRNNQTIQKTKGERKMSKQNENTKDIFATYKQCFDKVHGNVEKTIPQYLQSYTNLQQEFLSAWSNFVNSTLSIQQNICNKTGVNTAIPEATIKALHNATDEIIKVYDVQNKVVQTALDASRQNLRTVNQNAIEFAELNQNIINSWISTWKPNN